jgi:uncharacterized repeat protein (TIGR01451 family)
MTAKKIFIALYVLISALAAASPVFAWPAESQWVTVYQNYSPLQDNSSDTNGSRNIVSDSSHGAAYFYNDGSHIYFRLRLDSDPSGQGGQGNLQAFGWGVDLDTNNNPNDYEWLIMVDGIAKNEAIVLYQNTVQGIAGDPSDKPEIKSADVPLVDNYQVSAADSSINGDQDYFLDWRFPYPTFKLSTRTLDQTPIRMFFGASPSANSLSENGGDFVGSSDLVTGFSDYMTLAGVPLGTIPGATGAVFFTGDISGNTAITSDTAGNPLFIKVTDADMNANKNAAEVVSVSIATNSGDAESLQLTETGPDTGIFTGKIDSKLLSPPVRNNGTADVKSDDTLTAIYIDARDLANNIDQQRNATLTVSVPQLPQMQLVKSTDKTEATPGAEIIYTVHYMNIGSSDGFSVEIADPVPSYAAYVPGSMKLGDAGSTYDSAAAKTDGAGDDEAEFTNGSVLFRIPLLKKNDSAANSGQDEGNIFYKVVIQ